MNRRRRSGLRRADKERQECGRAAGTAEPITAARASGRGGTFC